MLLYENEAKNHFSRHGISIPKGVTVTDPSNIVQFLVNLKPPYMVKAQVRSGGRGKAGGIISAESLDEAKEATAKLIRRKIKKLLVEQVLIEEKIAIRKELYLGITVDRINRCYVVLSSAIGGIEIEEVAEKTPKAIIRNMVDSRLGVRSFHALSIAKQLGYSGGQLMELAAIIQKLYQVCIDDDAELVEINPLAETKTGSFIAVDARIMIDDNALFRHPEYEAKEVQDLSPPESLALENNLAYVKLDGNIGVVGNGAGLVMATLDLLNLFGGRPANFLDVGGGATTKAIEKALDIVLSDKDTKVILVNVLGGITRCDEVASGIIKATKADKERKHLVVRLVGTNQLEGQKILSNAGISVLDSMEEAAKQAVQFASGEWQ